MKHGKGRIIYENNDVYEGEWKLGQRSGKGVYRYSNGDVYDGQWAGDLK